MTRKKAEVYADRTTLTLAVLRDARPAAAAGVSCAERRQPRRRPHGPTGAAAEAVGRQARKECPAGAEDAGRLGLRPRAGRSRLRLRRPRPGPGQHACARWAVGAAVSSRPGVGEDELGRGLPVSRDARSRTPVPPVAPLPSAWRGGAAVAGANMPGVGLAGAVPDPTAPRAPRRLPAAVGAAQALLLCPVRPPPAPVPRSPAAASGPMQSLCVSWGGRGRGHHGRGHPCSP